MQEMRSQVAGIHQTQDPAKRAELLKAHMTSMHDMMKMMMQGAMRHMMERQQMLEQRQDRMMMDQMLQHQSTITETPRHHEESNDEGQSPP